MILKISHNAIFSQGLEVGVMPYDSPGYQMTLDFGQDHVHVRPSLFQERKKDLKTKDICGPSSQNSLTSAGLQLSLENRLKRQLNTDGSILFKMTWKDAATPAHRRYCLLRALARRTFDTDCIGGGSWPTPLNSEFKGNRTWKDKGQNNLLAHVIKGMATPRVFDSKEKPTEEKSYLISFYVYTEKRYGVDTDFYNPEHDVWDIYDDGVYTNVYAWAESPEPFEEAKE